MPRITILALLSHLLISAQASAQTANQQSIPVAAPAAGQSQAATASVSSASEEVLDKWLNQGCGDWRVTIRMHNQPKGERPREYNEIRCSISMILDGKIQEARHSGIVGEKNMEGISYTGYDPTTSRYTSTWMDNFGYGLSFVTGALDPKSGDVVFRGEKKDAKGVVTERTREVHHLTEKQYTITMYKTAGSTPEKLDMEVLMERM